MPSAIEYGTYNLGLTIEKILLCYLGVRKIKNEMIEEMHYNQHTALLTDPDQRKKIMSYLDINKIPDRYKKGRNYYQNYHEYAKNAYPENLSEGSVFSKDKVLADLVKLLYSPKVSPLFAEKENLIGLPKAYFIILEFDTIKDDGLLYAKRLEEAGVDVHIAFYDKAVFHGIVGLVSKSFGYEKARELQEHLIEYLKINL